ncbi:BRCT domain-containing protein/Pescadillo_N domain-containing protein [Cephalotus follicularis]|uniref:Pescadillo homolog n=1 Tax=Cephalotus follicularis TaxID=3775 RepID=A0A1Q3BQV5_CEPFO|nr:BRCT domain-containing protein/Pescadillo_N domain-containing protein [Cephalotus follicularis]
MPKHYRPPGKKKEGNAARYITRSQAVKQLQVSLRVFRRLCIFKGISPREPKKKFKGNHHSYYHTKDISFLQHDQLVETFRALRAYRKKINKAKAKKNKDLLRLLLTRQPTYTLDRLIKERYPTFIDSLRDLDDCLTMVHLFAALPAIDRVKIEVKRVHNCRRLCHEWQAYIARTHKLRKIFISVKGIYYQAEVEGQKITWLTPHALQQVLTDDVDFNVMLTFQEFYETLLAFINFRLYHSIGVKYPPILDSRLEALAADLYALSRYFDANSRASLVEPQLEVPQDEAQTDESELRLAQLQHQLPSNEPGALMHLVEDAAVETEDDEDTRQCRELFKNMKFFLSREVPRESLLFVIPAFGGVVSWEGEGAPFKEADDSITHQIVDRPSQGHVYLSREYVQPQWIYDCVNARIILPTENYMVGRVPPPHLSPFVDDEAEGYAPDYAKTIKQLQAAARNEILPVPGVGKEDLDDPQNLLAEGYISRTEAIEAAEKKRKMMTLEKQYHDELKVELQDSHISSTKQSQDMEAKEESLHDLQQIAEDSENMSNLIMSRKKRGLYEAIKIGEKRKQAGIDLLKERKRKIETVKN